MAAHNPTWVILGAAVVGIVTAAGVIISEYFATNQRRRRHGAGAGDLDQMNNELAQMRQQINDLKKLLSERKLGAASASATNERLPSNRSIRSNRSQKSSRSANVVGEDSELDSSDLEFYDVGEEEEETGPNEFADVDEMLDSETDDQVKSAFDRIESMLQEDPNRVELLWRMGKARHRLSLQNKKAVPVKVQHINMGLEACKKALELDDESGETHKWFAILTGTLTDHQNVKDKIQCGIFDFKNHLDQALRLMPNDPAVYHLIGRYNYEIASLSWIERRAAASISNKELPVCTHQDAINYLLKAEELSKKDWKENKLYLAKAYIAVNNYREAVKWLEQAHNAEDPSSTHDVDTEVRTLLAKYNSYR